MILQKMLVGILFCSGIACAQDSTLIDSTLTKPSAIDSATVANLVFDTRYKGVRVIKIEENPSGLALKDLGDGATQVKYICFAENGEVLEDISWRTNRALTFSKKMEDRYITGFTAGLKKFREGEKGYIWIPKKLGYGKSIKDPRFQGNLVYYVEVLVKH